MIAGILIGVYGTGAAFMLAVTDDKDVRLAPRLALAALWPLAIAVAIIEEWP